MDAGAGRVTYWNQIKGCKGIWGRRLQHLDKCLNKQSCYLSLNEILTDTYSHLQSPFSRCVPPHAGETWGFRTGLCSRRPPWTSSVSRWGSPGGQDMNTNGETKEPMLLRSSMFYRRSLWRKVSIMIFITCSIFVGDVQVMTYFFAEGLRSLKGYFRQKLNVQSSATHPEANWSREKFHPQTFEFQIKTAL